jgi:stage II sporulation protein M
MNKVTGQRKAVSSVDKLRLQDLGEELRLVSALFLVSVFAGLMMANNPPTIVIDAINEIAKLAETIQSGDFNRLFSIIFTNNLVAIYSTVIGGLLLGITPLISSVINGYVIGVVAGLTLLQGQGTVLAAGLMPHGIIEIPALIIALAIGLRLGRFVFSILKGNLDTVKNNAPGKTHKKNLQFYRLILNTNAALIWIELKRSLSLVWQILVPAVLIAAIIESSLTVELINNVLR